MFGKCNPLGLPLDFPNRVPEGGLGLSREPIRFFVHVLALQLTGLSK
jgi:hypothetical protein